MSSVNELGLTDSELQSASQPLRDRIIQKAARLKGLDLLTGSQIFRRNSRRLDATARAVRKQQGLDMPDDPDDEIVLGDKTTHYHSDQSERRGGNGGGVGKFAMAALIAAGLGLPAVAGVALWKAPEIIAAMKGEPTVDTDTMTDVTPGFGVPRDVQ